MREPRPRSFEEVVIAQDPTEKARLARGEHCLPTVLRFAIKKDFELSSQALFTRLPSPLQPLDDPKIKFFHQSRRWYNVPSRWGRQHEIADGSATVNPLGRSHNDRHPRKCILAGAERDRSPSPNEGVGLG